MKRYIIYETVKHIYPIFRRNFSFIIDQKNKRTYPLLTESHWLNRTGNKTKVIQPGYKIQNFFEFYEKIQD